MIQWVLPTVEYLDFQDTVSWSILRAGDQWVWDSLGILPFVDITSWCFAMFRSYWRWFQMLISSQQIGCDNSAPRKTSDFRLKDPTTDISSLSNFWIPIPIPNLSLSSLRIELIKSIPKVPNVPQVHQVTKPVRFPTAISRAWIQGSSVHATDWCRAVPSKWESAGKLRRVSGNTWGAMVLGMAGHGKTWENIGKHWGLRDWMGNWDSDHVILVTWRVKTGESLGAVPSKWPKGWWSMRVKVGVRHFQTKPYWPSRGRSSFWVIWRIFHRLCGNYRYSFGLWKVAILSLYIYNTILYIIYIYI